MNPRWLELVGPHPETGERDPVVICGGGPAGMMCGYLLARVGVPVTVLEKHKDFLRDFRGDTIHPSTLELLRELGILEEFLARPHQEVHYAEGELGDVRIRLADFTHLPTHCKFIAFMPQWDFLNFLAEQARTVPAFTLRLETEALRVVRDGDRVTGVEVRSPSGEERLHARLVIAADGRESVLRNRMGLEVKELGAPMDVLWFRLNVLPGDSTAVLGRIVQGQVLVRLYRGDYWQCALIIRKGTFEAVQREGLDAFRRRVASLVRRDTVGEIERWENVKLLTVKVDRLRRWAAPGILFIGDAAHAMSPIGASASTSRSRTPSRPRICWQVHCDRVRPRSPNSAACSGAAGFQPGQRKRCSSSFRIGRSIRCWRAEEPLPFPGSWRSCSAFPFCSESRRA